MIRATVSQSFTGELHSKDNFIYDATIGFKSDCTLGWLVFVAHLVKGEGGGLKATFAME